MRRIRITVAYDGTDFHGWQIQPDLPTIQGALQNAVSEIEGRPVQVDGSGRTDAGVHALAQVAAFSIANPIPTPNLKKALNRLLPPAIRVLSAEEAAPDFHPRRHARSKTYEYRIFRGEVCSPFERQYVLHHPYPLDTDRIIEAAAVFAGEHDFTAFAASDVSDAEGRSKVRTIFSTVARVEEDRLIYRVRGNGFLKHMVRNLVGTLLECGKGNLTPDDIRRLLVPGCGVKAGPTAPARGLFLVEVEY
ncbi:MAG TPA: tRNA pseudouridine(38-40) synthase TruA [Bryobacteraceae bacterium]|nr:tRNA pseudouridine(38-40) synthase TruA [Bryobacteraceae bacterium]HOQ46430.1 tRNA pseudouridine(38-40) synthase TruA [Bryobacteraceae bacterium]HPQ17229.1 tRNA pseudouridine(38-40) synthase TruA [Bryobacteraceae bacterium]HPU72591.1 tRNA pseudouridine(38-40) synthase TruA [Bryobacteraceae bacterium]